MEKVHAGRPEAHLFEIARHWAVAAVVGGAARAADWIERAGAEAMRNHAYEEGAKLFKLALDVGVDELDAAGRCRLLLGCGAARHLSSDLPGGLDACLRAAALAAEMGRPDLVAQAALVTEPTFSQQTDLVMRRLCETAIAAVRSEPAALRARVLARYAQVCDYLADVGPARAASKQSLALAERSGDCDALMAALHARQVVCSGPDGLDERVTLADRLLALAGEAASPDEQLWGHLWCIDVAFERGDFGRVAREMEVVARLAQEVRGPFARWQLQRCRAMLAQAHARFEDARRLADEAFATIAPTGHPAAVLMRDALLSVVGHHAGYSAELLAAMGLAEDTEVPSDLETAGVIRALAPAWVLAEVGRLPDAAGIYRSLGAVFDWRLSPHSTLFTYTFGIGLAIALDARDDVASLRDLLSDYRGHHVISGAGALGYFGPVELWIGTAAAHLGLFDTFWDRRDQDNIALFHYSDLLIDLPGQLRHLSDVLGIAVTDERLDQFADAATFDRMRLRADDLVPDVGNRIWRSNRDFFHRGHNRQWEELLDDDGLRSYDARVADLVPPDLAAWTHHGWHGVNTSAVLAQRV